MYLYIYMYICKLTGWYRAPDTCPNTSAVNTHSKTCTYFGLCKSYEETQV